MYPSVCWLFCLILPPHPPLLPSPASRLSFHLLSGPHLFPWALDLHLFSCALVFLRSAAALAASSSGDSDKILSYIVTRQYCDGHPGGNLSDPECAFSTGGGRCLPSGAKQRYNFENGYTRHHQGPLGIFHSGMRESPLLFHLAHEDVYPLTEWGTVTALTGVGISRCCLVILSLNLCPQSHSRAMSAPAAATWWVESQEVLIRCKSVINYTSESRWELPSTFWLHPFVPHMFKCLRIYIAAHRVKESKFVNVMNRTHEASEPQPLQSFSVLSSLI